MSKLDGIKQIFRGISSVDKKEIIVNEAMQLQLTIFFDNYNTPLSNNQEVVLFNAFKDLHSKSNSGLSPSEYAKKFYPNNEYYNLSSKNYTSFMSLVNKFVKGQTNRDKQIKVINDLESLLIQQQLNSETNLQETDTEIDRIDFKEISVLLDKMTQLESECGICRAGNELDKNFSHKIRDYFEKDIFPQWRNSAEYSQLDFRADEFNVETSSKLVRISQNYSPEKSRKPIEIIPIEKFKSEISHIIKLEQNYEASSDSKVRDLYMRLFIDSRISSAVEYSKYYIEMLNKLKNYINTFLPKV